MRYKINPRNLNAKTDDKIYETYVWNDHHILVSFESKEKPIVDKDTLLLKTLEGTEIYLHLIYGDTVTFDGC